MSRLLRTAAVILAAGSLALFGCGSSGGGDDDASSTTTTEAATTTTDAGAAFAAELNELCAAGRVTTDAAGEDLQTALDALTEADASGDTEAYAVALDDAETAAEDAIGAFEDFQAEVEGLDVPAESQADLDALVETVAETQSLTEDLRDAIAADDGQAFTDAFTALRDATAESDVAQADAAEALGAPDCAPNDAPSDASDTTDTTAED